MLSVLLIKQLLLDEQEYKPLQGLENIPEGKAST